MSDREPSLLATAEPAKDPAPPENESESVSRSATQEPTEIFDGPPTPAADSANAEDSASARDAATTIHDDDAEDPPTSVAATPAILGDPVADEAPSVSEDSVDDPLAREPTESDPEWESIPTKVAESRPAERKPAPRASRVSHPAAKTFHAAGFWRRELGACIDLAIILPVAILVGWLAGAVSGIHLPSSRLHGADFWLDLVLASDPAFLGWLGLTAVISLVYLVFFQASLGRTLGMAATKTRIIDAYGDAPTVARSALRSAGYLACLATVGLGFIWIAFDSEKRGLHDWIAGTYVIKS